MKKLLALLLVLAMVFSLMTVLTACGDEDDEDYSDEDDEDEDEDDKKDDEDEDEDRPVINTRPSESEPTESEPNEPEYIDTNSYYLIGTGTGDLADCDWTHEVEGYYLGQVGSNRFSILVELHEGDQFQICHSGSWDNQMGIGFVDGWEYANGINPITGMEHTAADKYYVEVRGNDGTVYFCGGAEWDNSCTLWNIVVVESGYYQLFLNTDPADPGNNTIEFEFLG